MFPVITGATGSERIYDGYPDVALDMIDSRTFDGRIHSSSTGRAYSTTLLLPRHDARRASRTPRGSRAMPLSMGALKARLSRE